MEEELEALQDGQAVRIHTGFPNPAADTLGRRTFGLDFNQLLIAHPSSTYLFRIAGNSWVEQGILNGDVAVIDRALTARPQDFIITWQNDNFTVCRRQQLPEGQEPWGVITAVIHTLRSKE